MTSRGTRLAKAIKFYVDLGWWVFSALGLVIMPILLLLFVAGVLPPENEETPLPIVFGVHLDDGALAAADPGTAGEYAALVSGQGTLRVRTSSRTAWGLMLVGTNLLFLVGAFVSGQLRKVLRTVVDGRPFARDNARRVRRVGLALAGWSVLSPLMEYAFAVPILDDVRVRGLILSPPIDFNPDLLFAGLAILVLAEIFRQASELQREQSLTV